MIDELDEALRRLLIRDLPIRNSEVDISFALPNREWSGRLSKPTINLYLVDARENTKLRQMGSPFEVERDEKANTSTLRRKEQRIDLDYMLSTWATEPEDQHRLLGRVLFALMRHLSLPEELVPEVITQHLKPVAMQVGQHDMLQNPTEMWGVLSNDMRPSLGLRVTVAINPHLPITLPLVRTSEVRYSGIDGTEQGEPAGLFMRVRGAIRSKQPILKPNVRIVDNAQPVSLRASESGETAIDFAIFNIQPGNYTLEISGEGRKTSRRPLKVPSVNYDMEV